MKIPPLTDMEPLPPVPELPSCSQTATVSAGIEEIAVEPQLDSDSDIEDDIIAGISAAVETGSMLDMETPKVRYLTKFASLKILKQTFVIACWISCAGCSW